MRDEHEYVDLMLTVEKGNIVGCEFYGEGRQAKPLTEPAIFLPVADNPYDARSFARLARRIIRWARGLSANTGSVT